MELQLYPNNTSGLPVVYNEAISDAERDPAILVFIHDDVHLCDFYWPGRIYESLQAFDVVGVAGGKKRVARQPAWASIEDARAPDGRNNLSGIVGHGNGFPCSKIAVFGPPRQECKLLDGLMLVVDSRTLARSGLKFDPRFAFHFYDLDFCRQAELKGLRMGTWPISVVHESTGAYGNAAWNESYTNYLQKYGE